MAPTRLSTNKQVALIPFVPDYDETTVQYVKHKRYEEDVNGEQE